MVAGHVSETAIVKSDFLDTQCNAVSKKSILQRMFVSERSFDSS